MASTKKSGAATFVFEPALEKMEAIATRLESENISIAEALTSFEEGVALTRDAQNALSAAEQKVKLLLEENEEPVASEVRGIEDPE